MTDRATTDRRSRARRDPRPSLLLIGAARSGTTALAAFLGEHPAIEFTRPKETHFFAYAGGSVRHFGPGDRESIERVAVTEPDEFRSRCASIGSPIVAEGSVSTMYYPDRSIPAIRQYASRDVRLLAILRNPVDRAHSAFEYLRARGFEDEQDFERALDLEPRRRSEGYSHLWHLVRQGKYVDQLAPFLSEFGRDRVLVVLSDELRGNGAGVLSTAFEFLEVDPIDVDTSVEFNRGGEPRSNVVATSTRWLRRSGLGDVARRVTTARMRARFDAAQLSRSEMPPRARARLDAEFGPEIDRLEDLLERDLSIWKPARKPDDG